MSFITFADGKTYTISSVDWTLDYVETGDRHGNNNIRSNLEYPSVFQFLCAIDPILSQNALAATIDEKPVSLATKLNTDCQLDIITAETPIGRIIYHRTLAFLLAKCVSSLTSDFKLQNIEVTEKQCILRFPSIHYKSSSHKNVLESELAAVMEQNSPLMKKDIWPKEMLLSSFASLQCPYNQIILSQYDDYESVPIIFQDNFALVTDENSIFALLPSTIKDFSLDFTMQDASLILNAFHCETI